MLAGLLLELPARPRAAYTHPMTRRSPTSDPTFAAKVLQAKAMTPSERFKAGFDLFDQSLMLMRAGIRATHPKMTDAEVESEVDRRLAIARRLKTRGRRTP